MGVLFVVTAMGGWARLEFHKWGPGMLYILLCSEQLSNCFTLDTNHRVLRTLEKRHFIHNALQLIDTGCTGRRYSVKNKWDVRD